MAGSFAPLTGNFAHFSANRYDKSGGHGDGGVVNQNGG
jgi:hypothetical protein